MSGGGRRRRQTDDEAYDEMDSVDEPVMERKDQGKTEIINWLQQRIGGYISEQIGGGDGGGQSGVLFLSKI